MSAPREPEEAQKLKEEAKPYLHVPCPLLPAAPPRQRRLPFSSLFKSQPAAPRRRGGRTQLSHGGPLHSPHRPPGLREALRPQPALREYRPEALCAWGQDWRGAGAGPRAAPGLPARDAGGRGVRGRGRGQGSPALGLRPPAGAAVNVRPSKGARRHPGPRCEDSGLAPGPRPPTPRPASRRSPASPLRARRVSPRRESALVAISYIRVVTPPVG